MTPGNAGALPGVPRCRSARNRLELGLELAEGARHRPLAVVLAAGVLDRAPDRVLGRLERLALAAHRVRGDELVHDAEHRVGGALDERGVDLRPERAHVREAAGVDLLHELLEPREVGLGGADAGGAVLLVDREQQEVAGLPALVAGRQELRGELRAELGLRVARGGRHRARPRGHGDRRHGGRRGRAVPAAGPGVAAGAAVGVRHGVFQSDLPGFSMIDLRRFASTAPTDYLKLAKNAS